MVLVDNKLNVVAVLLVGVRDDEIGMPFTVLDNVFGVKVFVVLLFVVQMIFDTFVLVDRVVADDVGLSIVDHRAGNTIGIMVLFVDIGTTMVA